MNNKKEGNFAIFFASFATLLAAGMGMSLRAGGILGDWSEIFGFTKSDLGVITGFGFWPFGLTIIFFSFFSDFVGYRALLILAFLLHVGSLVVAVSAKPVYDYVYDSSVAAANISNTSDTQKVKVTLASTQAGEGDESATPRSAGAVNGEINIEARNKARTAAKWVLIVGMFMFSLANGVCEAAINPLVATLYPTKKTHYLNVLHAGWPGGLILGAVLAYMFVGEGAIISHLPWEAALSLFLIPTVIYGVITLLKKFPISETKAAGVRFGETLAQFASPILLFLLLLHAMVGYVELGTDNWIVNIMSNVMKGHAVLVLLYTSVIMFVLRFFAGPIVERINPIGLLLVSAILAAIGLVSLSFSQVVAFVFFAATIYGVGKTFFWSTMLGVVGERYPKGGAVALGMSGGIGMLSAGLLGTPIIGYQQDYFATQRLQAVAPQTYEEYRAEEARSPLFLPPVQGLEGTKAEEIKNKQMAYLQLKSEKPEEPIPPEKKLTEQEEQVFQASIYGGRMALRLTAIVPAMMAVGYLLLFIYFWSRGGYKVEVLHGKEPEGEEFTGGVEGPVR